MSERQIAVYNQFRNAQDKYTYFLLAAAGAAVALALRETASAPLAWSEIPLAAAVLCWGSSFFSGCRHLTLMASSLYSNFQLLCLSEAEMQLKLTHREKIAETAQALQLAIQRNSSRAECYGKLQFRLLISGAMFYVGWHIWEMWVRTLQSLLK